MKSLKIIQTLSKIGMILSKIVYICCIIGAVGCAVGLISLPFTDNAVIKIGGVSLHTIIIDNAGFNPISLYPAMTGAMILCIGHTVLAKFAETYFKNELVAQTPFTIEGANEMLRLGILTICIPLGCLILSEIVSGVISGFLNCEDLLKINNGGSVMLGVVFVIISVLLRCATELQTKNQ